MIHIAAFTLNLALFVLIVLNVFTSGEGKIFNPKLVRLLGLELLLLVSICIAGYFDFYGFNKAAIEEGFSLCKQYLTSSFLGSVCGLVIIISP
jgi:hypothetical protein